MWGVFLGVVLGGWFCWFYLVFILGYYRRMCFSLRVVYCFVVVFFIFWISRVVVGVGYLEGLFSVLLLLGVCLGRDLGVCFFFVGRGGFVLVFCFKRIKVKIIIGVLEFIGI